MKKQIFTAMAAAVLIFTALPAMAQDRGNHRNHVRHQQQERAVERQTLPRHILKPILALIRGDGAFRLGVGAHRGASHGDRHYDSPKRHRHDHRYFRSWRKHQAWHNRHDRHDRKHRRQDRRNRRHNGHG
ncbi:MAG: hypothetical protein HOK30_12305 [Rhodospirillaceae bacterium]|jgi:hypothetical protein|nr:hypothetical protein [Rhodospirillaceae bacterium]MBT5895576.1 hypothetical protein [Rhodospirillaceae bacterium]MBT6428438.1 hypothetical protein [Rhodospirillaceae bacterium]MBT7758638.1 hypothetical protein [Rhodospirillaceae bacterium]